MPSLFSRGAGRIGVARGAAAKSSTPTSAREPDTAGLPGAPQIAGCAGDVEFVQAFAAKGATLRAVVRKCLGFQDPAGRRHDVDQRPRSGLVGAGADDEVAVGIEAEAFRAVLRPAMIGAETVQQQRAA